MISEVVVDVCHTNAAVWCQFYAQFTLPMPMWRCRFSFEASSAELGIIF